MIASVVRVRCDETYRSAFEAIGFIALVVVIEQGRRVLVMAPRP